MFEDILSFAIGIFASLLIKAFIEPGGTFYLQKYARAFVPSLLDRIDNALPEWMQTIKSAQELEERLFDELLYIPESTKLSYKEQEKVVKEALHLYDPRITLDKLNQGK